MRIGHVRIAVAMFLVIVLLHGVRADVPADVQAVAQRLDHFRSVWSNSIDDAYVVGTNLFWDVRNMTNYAWRGTCVTNCLDLLVALPHVSYAKDMVAYTNREVCGEKDIQALKSQFLMLSWGHSWFKDIAPDHVFDSAFTLTEEWKREADLQLKAYEKIAITNWSEYYKNAHIAFFTNRQNLAKWEGFYAALREQYSSNLERSAHVHALAARAHEKPYDFFDCWIFLYYRSATPERQAYIRKRLVELLGSVPRCLEDELENH